ncbi:deaminase [Streptomyces sp. NBC_01304]|uniref:deaminase n=1 Tax=Streptomyces sp. NBC_01304 TaxID=2903818 RepID=UPI002E141BC4|nr:dCMP deaminase [Streptomyces sp. NBC_01304]
MTTATPADDMWMRMAVELAHHCPPAEGAYSVGAVIVDRHGDEVARGYSREDGDPHVHAEEAALGKVTDSDRLQGGTIYSSLEPCSQRKSRPVSCAEHILRSGLSRVVIAWREPAYFVDNCQGAELLTAAGLSVVELPLYASDAREANKHLDLPE